MLPIRILAKTFEFCITAVLFVFIAPFYIVKELISALFGKRPPDHKKLIDMNGIDYEAACAKRLAAEGYRHIQITPPSGDFGADIVAVDKKGRKVCFQCKKYSGSVGVSAVQEVHSSRAHYNAQRAVVLTTSTFTKAAKKLAKETGVELVEHYYPIESTHWVDRIEAFEAIDG